jgi:hypothetical protein
VHAFDNLSRIIIFCLVAGLIALVTTPVQFTISRLKMVAIGR